jgi:N,N'-diacetyllegionaminate synthase
MTVQIGEREIGPGHPAYIIAEIGSNHNGDLDLAVRLIDIAASAGATAAKFQIFSADSLYSRLTPGVSYLGGEDTHDLIEKIETPRGWISLLADHCRRRGIDFLATPFDREAVDLLEPYVPAFKIASFEIVDLEFIHYIAGTRKTVILSTGMASLGEIEDAVAAIRGTGNDAIVLLQCTSLYPAPCSEMNLRAMQTMATAFRLPVGLSDHTSGIHVPVAAVALGASMLEKHITLSRTMAGPDHAFALEPPELAEMVSGIREIEAALGTGIKELQPSECGEMYGKARRSIHAAVPIPRGTRITREMLTVKRPGYGIPPKYISLVAGRTARQDIPADQWILWTMI